MGAGNTLRWIEDATLRTMMNTVVDGVATCKNGKCSVQRAACSVKRARCVDDNVVSSIVCPQCAAMQHIYIYTKKNLPIYFCGVRTRSLHCSNNAFFKLIKS